MALIDFAPPEAWGIPSDRFPDWRDGQVEAVLSVTDSVERFVALAAPTGFGKSLAYAGAAAVSGMRTAILTSTKGLQQQLTKDFGRIVPVHPQYSRGMVDVRGQVNYQCVAAPRYGLPEYTSCAEGPCHSGVHCPQKSGGCLYYDAYNRAKGPDTMIVVTNYAYWLNITNGSEDGLGAFDCLVLDEAHNALDELAGYLGTEIEDKEVTSLLGVEMMSGGPDQDQWREWAGYCSTKAGERVDTLTAAIRAQGERPSNTHIKEAWAIKQLKRKLDRVAGMKGEWVAERIEDNYRRWKGWKWDPLFPSQYAERYLFRGVGKVVLVSATCRPKTLDMMGIKEDDRRFDEYPSAFPIERRPVYHVPTVQLNHRADPSHVQLWLNRIDQIIASRTDRKGIIHTVSYARAKQIVEHSSYKHLMVTHYSNNARTVIEQFKRRRDPCILVSPSVSTGYDFPYEECEYQIIGKVPFPDNRGAVVKARMKHDKDYGNYVAMQQLVQACGRGMRAVDDQCECLVLDDSWVWFHRQNKHFAPDWFNESLRWVRTIPAPLPKL